MLIIFRITHLSDDLTEIHLQYKDLNGCNHILESRVRCENNELKIVDYLHDLPCTMNASTVKTN